MWTNKIIIKPESPFSIFDFSDVLRYRELFYIFTWRDIKVRYKQTVLGILWVIFQPLFSTLVFTFFFGKLAQIRSGTLPYSLFVLSGLVFWQLFSTSLSHASDSMVANEGIIKKVYFPKIILPLASVLTSFVDFVINFVILIIFSIVVHNPPNLTGFIYFPFAILLTCITAAGIGFFLSSINVKFRDVRYILPFFIQILLFLTPIIYPLSIVSDRNKIIMAVNPITSVVEMVRAVFTNGRIENPNLIFISFFSAISIFIFGLWYFKKTEQSFTDIL